MRPNGVALFLFVSTLSVPARAAIRTWPGPAPCAGTLQECIDAATAGDFILIATNVVIAENLTLSKSLVLQPSDGFAPRLAPGFGISGTSSGGAFYSVVVRRLALTDARVVLTHAGSGSAHMEVRGLTITSTNSTAPAGIRVSASLSGAAGIRIAENRLRVAVPSLFDAAIEVEYQGSSGSALVDFNRVETVADAGGWGILADATLGATPTVTIANNEVRGLYGRNAITVTEGLFSSTPSTVTARLIGNAVIGRDRQGGGISHTIYAGSIDTQLLSNTAVDTGFAAGFSRWSGSPGTGTITGTVLNNLVAFNNFGLFINPEFQAGVTENYNLVFNNTSNSYTPGPNDVTSNPMLRALNNPRLAQASPAIDVGDSSVTTAALTAAGLGQLDVDGLRRVKASVVDIGAYEYGDKSLLARADSPAFNYFAINHPATNGFPNARLFTVSNFGPTDEPPLPPLNAESLGVWYSAGTWRIFNQSGATMPAGARFNVFVPGAGTGVFVHTATAGTITAQEVTVVNDPSLNSNPNKVVLVTPNWNPGGAPGIYNNHPISIGYSSPTWFIRNDDLGALNVNAAFNVYAQDPSPNAFVHTATTANIAGSSSSLDHPLLNGVRCAQVNVSRRGLGILPVATTLDVYYNPAIQRWSIFNHNSVPMALGAEFFVVVDPGQVFDCTDLIFKDGFQA